MKNSIVSLLLVLVLTLMCVPAFAEEFEETAYVNAENGLFLRAKAELDAKVITGLGYGTEVTILKYTKNGFARVCYHSASGDFIGYVWTDFLTTQEEAEEEELPEGEIMYVSSYTGLVMRQWPKFDSEILARVGMNSEVLVLETRGLWSKCIVEVNGEQIQGFMWNEYLIPGQISEEAAWAVHTGVSGDEPGDWDDPEWDEHHKKEEEQEEEDWDWSEDF